jgi:CSLREA domain-containing protein
VFHLQLFGRCCIRTLHKGDDKMSENRKCINPSIPLPQIRKTTLALGLSQVLTLSAPVAQAATITVTTDSGDTGGPDCTLRDAITAANFDTAIGGCPAGSDADLIVLPDHSTITLTTPDNPDNGLPIVTSSITIEGNGTTIERDPNSPEFRIFELNGNSLTLQKTIVSGGRVYGERNGGIYAHNSSALTLIDSVVSKNQGAIEAQKSSSITLINSKVSLNVSNYDRYLIGGGIFSKDSSVTLTNSTVSMNSGVGIFSINSPVTITNSTLSRNTGTYCRGGGIAASSSSVMLTNSTVSKNLGCNGGGIEVQDSTLTLINSTVSGNSAEYEGGGIFAFDSSLTLINSTITANSHQKFDDSGGIKLRNYRPQFQLNLILNNSIIANNDGKDCVNEAGATPNNANSLVSDGGINCGAPLLTGDPKLGPLRRNGGPTRTHALRADSPAIDAGDDTICATLPKNAWDQPTDQRGRSRTGRAAGAHCDIGAYEFRRRRRE